MAFFNYDLQEKLLKLGILEYNRRSSTDTEDKQMRSIEGQHEDIQTDIISKFNLKNVLLLQESQSAFKMGRPKFSELIELIENGVVQVVLVWHPNRIARNYSDGGKFVQLMADGKLQYVITPHGIFENSPKDQEYLMTEFTRATRDSGDKSDSVKRGNRTKLKKGYIPSGRLAEGFIHTKNDKDEMINGADIDRLPLIKKAIQLVLNQTHTPKAALELLNNEWGYRTHKTKRTGGNPLSDSTWYKILSDPKYYYGEIHRSEGVFNAGEEIPRPFTRDDYEKIQIILGNKSSRRQTKKDWAYTGLGMICGECNGTIIMDEKWQIICPICKVKFHKSKDRNECPNCKIALTDMEQPKILHYTWLFGNHKKLPDGTKCTQHSLAVKDFEPQIDKLLQQITIPEKLTNWAIKWLQKEHTKEVKDRSTIKSSLQTLDADVQEQLDLLLDLLLKKQISPEEYQKKKELLLLEQQQVRRKLQETDKRADNWLELSEKTFIFSTYARHWFATGTNQQKREILSTLGTNLMLKDKIMSLYQRKPFRILNGMQEKIDILLDVYEPDDLLDTMGQNPTSHPLIPNLLRDMDSNHDKQIQSLLSCH